MEADVQAFLSEFEAGLVSLAAEKRASELKSRLADLRALINGWEGALSYSQPERGMVIAFGYRHPRSKFELNLYTMCKAASDSNDSSTVWTVAEGLLSIALDLIAGQSPSQAGAILEVVRFLYSNCVSSVRLAESLEAELDTALWSLSASQRFGGSLELTHGRCVLYRFNLHLIWTALDHSREVASHDFVDRLLDFIGKCESDSTEQSHSSREFLILVVISLLIRSSRGTAGGNSAANGIAGLVFSKLPSFATLAMYWDYRSSDFESVAQFEQQFGIREDEFVRSEGSRPARVGKVFTSSRGVDWLESGVMLACALANDEGQLDYSDDQDSHYGWDIESAVGVLSDAVDFGLLGGVTKGKREFLINRLRERFDRRERAVNTERIRSLLSQPIADKFPERVACRMSEKLSDSCDSLLRELTQAGPGMSVLRELETARVNLTLPRNWVVGDATKWNRWCEEDAISRIEKQEAMHVAWAFEGASDKIGEVNGLGDFASSIRRSRAEFRKRTKANPTHLVIPLQSRFLSALFGLPRWQIPRDTPPGDAVVATWEGLRIVEFPYSNPNSALLVNAELLGLQLVGSSESQVEVDLVDPLRSDSYLTQPYQEAVNCLGRGEDVCVDVDKLKVNVRVSLAPRFSVNRISAIGKIELIESGCFFHFDKVSKLIHRPTCSELPSEGSFKYEIDFHNDDGYTHCPKCDPLQWGDFH